MRKVTLRTVHDAVSKREEFRCNSTMNGEWVDGPHVNFGRITESVSLANHLMGSCKNFVVYSYSTPIAVYNHKGWWKNPEKYSVTTSRHMSAIRL